MTAVPICREKYADAEELVVVIAVDAALKTRSLPEKAPARFPERVGAELFLRGSYGFAVEHAANGSIGCFASNDSLAASYCGSNAACGYNGMIRICCVAGISTTLLDDRDSTKRLAVIKSASENAATNDAHAN